MKTKIITKTFYVSDETLRDIKDPNLVATYRGLYVSKSTNIPHEVQISWQEPEKKIEISESRLEELRADWIMCKEERNLSYHEYLTIELFGNREG